MQLLGQILVIILMCMQPLNQILITILIYCETIGPDPHDHFDVQSTCPHPHDLFDVQPISQILGIILMCNQSARN